MEGNKSEKTVNGRTGNERGLLDGSSKTRKPFIEYSCISYFEDGKCPRAHTKFCPFVIKGKDFSSECMYE